MHPDDATTSRPAGDDEGPAGPARCTTPGPQVSLLYFDGCPNWRIADRRLRVALTQVGRGDAEVQYRQVTTAAEAAAAEFRGSPTVLVDGRDPFLDDDSPVGLSCRVYRTADGLSGSPTVEQLVRALR